MPRRTVLPGSTGFTLLPVVLAMSLVAAIAFLLNRDNGVNANLIGAQSDRERARYAAEAGLQAANYAIQANACAGGYPILSSPVTDSNFGGAAYSAYANHSSGSPLTLTSTGSYNGASVRLTKPTVYAFRSGIRTWTAQPDAGSSKDTAVVAGSPNSNYGGNSEIILDGSGTELLIQFDLSTLPWRSKIVPWYGAGQLQPGANLMLHRNNTTSATESIYVMLITHSWSENSATWNSPWPSPGVGYDYQGLPNNLLQPVSTNPYLTVLTNPYSTVLNWQSLDLTNAAIAWMNDLYLNNGLYHNYGVWIRGGPLVVNAKFALSSDSTAAKRPMLVVSYLMPC